MTQHLHAEADQQSLLAPHRLTSNSPKRVEKSRQYAVHTSQQEHNQREQDIVGEHGYEEDQAHSHVDYEHQEFICQVPGDPVGGRNAIGQVARQPVFEELHRQPQQPSHPAAIAGHRYPDREPLEESVLEQGQDVYQDTSAKQGGYQSAPGPMLFHHVVDENAERCGDDQRQERQHESAGNHPGKHTP